MSPVVRWLIIAAVLAVACINPLYRHYGLKEPIVTLGLDLKGGVEVLLQAKPENGGAPTPDQVVGAIEVVSNRVDPSGTKELFLSQVGTDRILLQVPGEKNPDQIIAVLGDTALLEFINTGNDSFPEGTEFNDPGSSERKADFAKYETILTGADLEKATVLLNANKPEIGFTFRSQARDTFGTFTTNHVGQFLAIILDGKVLSCPRIDSAIWGDGRITGTFTMEEVNKVVRQLNAGALPVPLQILSSSVVGPTLGQESIDQSYLAGLVGMAAVLLFLIIFYRVPGVVASISLCLYVVLVVGYFSLINATLTLPGIAGLLLGIGMAVDGNVIIFERLKEELRWGKTLFAAIEAAFSRAWVAILDGNVTTMIGAAVLYFFGTGPIKGFAVTLFIGNLVSLFSAVFVTRQLIDVFAHAMPSINLYTNSTAPLEKPSVQLAERRYFGWVERSPLWIGISVAIIAVGIVFLFINNGRFDRPLNLGIDFTGGEKIILQVKDELPLDGQSLLAIVQKFSDGEPTVQVDATDRHVASIRLRVKASGESEAEISRNRAASLADMKKEIGTAFGGFVAESEAGANPVVREQSFVGPTVGRELINNALAALIVGMALIFIYIVARFGIWQMSAGAILALLHDVFITLAMTSILGLEVNSSFIAVILTIVGYSINDSVIIFDRIRENLRGLQDANFSQLCNLSLSQTFTRSLNTVLNVVWMVAALLLLGGDNIRDFMLAMLIGMVSGGYSSIFIATPMMLLVSKGRSPGQAVVAAAPAAIGSASSRSAMMPEMESEDYPPLGGAVSGSGGSKKQRRR